MISVDAIPFVPVSPRERDLLRRLAARVRAIAESEENRRKISMAKKSNALQAERPIIYTQPENAWNEIIPGESLECANETLRRWELQLRQRVFWADEIKCDHSAYPYLEIPWKISWGDHWGVEIKKHSAGSQPGASWAWSTDFPIKDIAADLPKLHYREPQVDRAATLAEVELAGAVFGDLLPARVHWGTYWGTYWATFGLTVHVLDLVGMENLMLLFYDDPNGVHALMRFLRDDMLHVLDSFERQGLLHDNCDADYIGSGGPGHTDELPAPGRPPGAPVRLRDMWGFGESQDTVGIGADMFAEFILPYQAQIAEKFGLNYYGCCEPLEKRFACLKAQIPRLRRLSVSPWANIEEMAALLGRDYVYCRKSPPMPVCAPRFDEMEIRADLRATLRAAGHLNLELVLKDTHTVNCEPGRLARWVAIAREEVDRFFA